MEGYNIRSTRLTRFRVLNTFYLLYPFDSFQSLNKCFKTSNVIKHDNECATEQTVMRINVDATQNQFFFFGNNTRQIVYNAYVIHANDSQGYAVLRGTFP